MRQLLSNLDPRIRGVRWVNAEQMHLTLAFFADVPQEINLAFRKKLSGIEFGAFFLPIIGVGAFPPRGWPKVIWIGVGRGHPHITIARCRDVAPQLVRQFLKSNIDLDAGMIRVDSFHLYSSTLTPAGPIHTRELSVGCRE